MTLLDYIDHDIAPGIKKKKLKSQVQIKMLFQNMQIQIKTL